MNMVTNEKAIKVLIVDDELRIGMLIKKLVKWDDLVIECLDVVDNGKRALEIIKSGAPQIVITDIRMPKINGLDLINMTRDFSDQVKFIVISGYKEFEYAHRALQYGVQDYLLKPIDEDALNSVLQKIINELQQESYEEEKKKKLEKSVMASDYIIRENVLNSIIEGNKEISLEGINQEYNLKMEGELYNVLDVKLDYWDYENNNKRQDQITQDKIIDIIEKYLKEIVTDQLICKKQNLHIHCLISFDIQKRREVKSCINSILSEIQAFLLQFEQYEITIGVGKSVDEFGRIYESVRDANRAVNNRIKLGTGRLIYIETIKGTESLVIEKIMVAYKEGFVNSVENYNRQMFEQCVNHIFGEIQKEEGIDYSIYYFIANYIIDFFFETVKVESKEGEELKTFLNSMSHLCYTITKLKQLLKEYLGEYLDTIYKIAENKSTKPIREAKRYIEAHYAEKIVLEDLAEIVELNPVYFSALFKKETNMNFSTYLTNVRMEVAKSEIKNGNETIAAIAEKVGYKDTRHFSQTFTKNVGVKPALYRKLHS